MDVIRNYYTEIEQLEQDKALLEANYQLLEQQIKDAEEVSYTYEECRLWSKKYHY